MKCWMDERRARGASARVHRVQAARKEASIVKRSELRSEMHSPSIPRPFVDDQRRLCRLLSACCLPHAPGPMKTLATAFRDGEVHAHAARTHATGLFTHDVHSIGFRDPIPAPAAVVAAIAFGHVVTALFVYGLHLG